MDAWKESAHDGWTREERVRPLFDALVSVHGIPTSDATVLALVSSFLLNVREGDPRPDGLLTADNVYGGGRVAPRASHFSARSAAPREAPEKAGGRRARSRSRSRERPPDGEKEAPPAYRLADMRGPVVTRHDNHYVVKVECRGDRAASVDWLRRVLHLNDFVSSEPVVSAEVSCARGHVYLCARVLACRGCEDLPAPVVVVGGANALGRVVVPNTPRGVLAGDPSLRLPAHVHRAVLAHLAGDPLGTVAREDALAVAAVATAVQCIVGGHDDTACSACVGAVPADEPAEAPAPPALPMDATVQRMVTTMRRELAVSVDVAAVPGVSAVVAARRQWYDVRVGTALPFVLSWDGVADVLRAVGEWGRVLWVRVEGASKGGGGGTLSVGVTMARHVAAGRPPPRCLSPAAEGPHGCVPCTLCPVCVASVPTSRQVGYVSFEAVPPRAAREGGVAVRKRVAEVAARLEGGAPRA